jgi:beta-mannosidase
MGSLWWQLCDSNPCISWSTIDYFGRWKAAQYYAKRFHAPILLSAGLYGVPKFNISNETTEHFSGTIFWEMRNAESAVVTCGSIKTDVSALSSKFFKLLDELQEFYEDEKRRRHYLSYRLENTDGETVSSGISLLCPPKQFERAKAPSIRLEMRKLPEHYIITVTSDTFVPAAVLETKTVEIPFSDNWFPLNAGEPVNVFIPRRADLNLDVLRAEITVRG